MVSMEGYLKMKNDYPSISVSKFFEDMVNEGNIRPEASPMTASDPSMPDLREVSEVDVNAFFGKPSAPKKQVVTEAKAPSKDLKQEMLELMVEFKQVVQKANKLFSEMAVTAGSTTAGMFAPNFGGSKSEDCFKKEEAKKGYKKPVKMLKRKQR